MIKINHINYHIERNFAAVYGSMYKQLHIDMSNAYIEIWNKVGFCKDFKAQIKYQTKLQR